MAKHHVAVLKWKDMASYYHEMHCNFVIYDFNITMTF